MGLAFHWVLGRKSRLGTVFFKDKYQIKVLRSTSRGRYPYIMKVGMTIIVSFRGHPHLFTWEYPSGINLFTDNNYNGDDNNHNNGNNKDNIMLK